MTPDLSRKLEIDALYRCKLLDRRLADSSQASEIAQQCTPPHRPDSFDIVEHGPQPRAATEFAIIGDREAMRLVANPHEQKQCGRVSRQDDRVLAIRQENTLFGLHHRTFTRIVEHVLLGDRNNVNLIEQLVLLQNFDRDIELALAAVDYPEVGELVVGDRTLEAPAQDLVHTGEVVLPIDRAHPVAAIKLLLRPALVEGHLRCDHHRALQVRDVVAFHPLGRVAQMELRAQLLEHLLACVLVVPPCGETLPRVIHRHLEQAQLVATLRHQEVHIAAAPLREQLGAYAGVLELDRHDNLVGHEARTRVILRQQISKHVLVGKFEVLEAPALRAREFAMAHHQDDRLDEAALAIEPEDVLIAAPMMQYGLALDSLFDCAHAVAYARRLFELEPLGVAAHPLAHLLEQLEVLALEQHLGGV